MYIILEASKIFDSLHVVIGVNADKKYHFSVEERERMLTDSMHEEGVFDNCDVEVSYLDKDFLITKAADVGATNLVRGVRSIKDFEYEMDMAKVNRRINPDIGTIYIFPPAEISEISSSIVRGLVGINGWENVVKQYVSANVLEALSRKHKEQK